MFSFFILCIITYSFGQICSPNNYRKDCGYSGITQQECEQKGCCWQPTEGNAGIPWCFFPWTQAKGYRLSSVNTTSFGLVGTLDLIEGTGMYGEDITPLQLTVWIETESRIHVQIKDPNNSRWEVPFVQRTVNPSEAASNTDYEFSYTIEPFGFAVTRKSTGEVLWNSTSNNVNPFDNLIFEDQYIAISTQLPSNKNIYGLGEHLHSLKLTDQIYTLWNRDQGTPSNLNLYGAHPFYLDLRSDTGNANGAFIMNSNGMDILLSDGFLQYRMIGGIVDMWIFTGPEPEDVINQYLDVIGRPYLPPYWGFGFHQCRYGYRNVSELENVVANYISHNIPLETMWTDIDYMNQYQDFTFDPVNFPPDKMNAFINNLHANSMHYVFITDPGIHNQQGYTPFDNGTAMGIWLLNNQGTPFIGKVWPGTTTFPDFFHPDSFDYWKGQIADFHQVAAFDGLWIDMNEISNFCTGQCDDSLERLPIEGFDPNNPPYPINNGGSTNQLDSGTIAMDAQHYNTIEYNVHNMFGLMESWATHNALEKVRGKRAFVISRSTFASSGTHTGHWTGDIHSQWSDLYLTIPDIMNFNMFGVPLIGADICGFIGDTTPELCARWIQVGAFYPFSRNHNDIGNIPQELYRWPEVANTSRVVLSIRYSLLPYYYTLFYRANSGIGATVIRPLFFEFPTDLVCTSLDTQLLIGEGVMIAPVLTQGATSVEVYFPQQNWFDFYTFKQVSNGAAPMNLTVSAPLEVVPIYILGGAIFPMQEPAYSIAQTRQNPMSLVVAFNTNGEASGDFFWDDGDSLNTTQNGQYSYITYQAQYANGKGTLINQIVFDGYTGTSKQQLLQINLLGISTKVNSVTVNGNSAKFQQDGTSVFVSNLQLFMNSKLQLNWN